MDRNKIKEINYKGTEKDAIATLDMLKKVIEEMEDYGLSIYNKKWRLQTQINKTNLAEDIQAIEWK